VVPPRKKGPAFPFRIFVSRAGEKSTKRPPGVQVRARSPVRRPRREIAGGETRLTDPALRREERGTRGGCRKRIGVGKASPLPRGKSREQGWEEKR